MAVSFIAWGFPCWAAFLIQTSASRLFSSVPLPK